MLVVQNRRVNKQYVIGGSGIFDFLIRTFTGNVAKQLSSSTAKEVGKAALDAGKTVAVDGGKN